MDNRAEKSVISGTLKKVLCSYLTIGILWGTAALVIVMLKYHGDADRLNNWLIYRKTFYHAVEHLNLYAYYPEEYFDHNLYGPLFSLLIAPFAVLPKLAGAIVWELFLAGSMFYTLMQFPGKREKKILLMWYVSNEVVSALLMTQFNMIIAAIVPATYLCLRKEKEWGAGLLVAIGTLTKIYGIAGLCVLPLIKHRGKFAVWTIVWLVILTILPMMVWGWEYAADQYREWYLCLSNKNELNTAAASVIDLSFHQNVSLLGMLHRISGREFSDLYILVPAMILFCAPYIRVKQYESEEFRWGMVASALMSLILFSTGSETSGYIMALTGVGIWYWWAAPEKRGGCSTALLLFALILGSFGHSDLMPKYLRNEYIRPYVLKALPIAIVWILQEWELLTKWYSAKAED